MGTPETESDTAERLVVLLRDGDRVADESTRRQLRKAADMIESQHEELRLWRKRWLQSFYSMNRSVEALQASQRRVKSQHEVIAELAKALSGIAAHQEMIGGMLAGTSMTRRIAQEALDRAGL